jgi:cell division protein FtsA
MEEIIDAVVYQLEESDCYEKLTAGIVLTGGGSLMRHLPQLVKYRTGLDVRIGKPDVQLLGNDLKEVNHPMYSTSVGLLLKGFEIGLPEPEPEPAMKQEPVPEFAEEEREISGSRPGKGVAGLFESIRNTFDGLFDDGPERKM